MSSILNIIQSKLRIFSNAHPLVKGMVSYAMTYPTSSMIQQTFEDKNLKSYDWYRLMRFSIYGSLFVAPTYYCWIRLSTAMWPTMSLRTGIIKALVEEISYGPFSYASFFFLMSLLEFKTSKEAAKEVRIKFWPTYQAGFCVWPIFQTINFSMVPESNRVVFVSVVSLMWTTFLAFMKRKDITIETSPIQTKMSSNRRQKSSV